MTHAVPLQTAPFASDFVDVPSLNAHVSEHVLGRAQAVHEGALAGLQVPSAAIVVLGPAGSGKTHLFARLRYKAGPRATFVLIRPYFGVSLTPRDVLAMTVDQLCRPAKATGLSQLDVIVAGWLADPSANSEFPNASFDELRAMSTEGRAELVERATGRVITQLPELVPAARLVRSLLGTFALERADAWSELAWLSGREPRRIAPGDVLGEPDVVHVLRLLAVLAARAAPLVFTFDQLENLASEGEERVLAYGNLLAELVDSIPCLTIVQLALTSEWIQFIEPRLGLPQKTRVASETFSMALPTRQERELLLRLWHERLALRHPNGRAMRFPRPLAPEQLEELLRAPGMTPRILLASLSRVARGKPLAEPTPATPLPGLDDAARVTQLVDQQRRSTLAELEEKERKGAPLDGAELAEGLAAALSFVPSLDVKSRTERERVTTTVRGHGHELVVMYLTSTHHASVAAVLARAAETARVTKVVIVRERRLDLPSSWATVLERRAVFERLPNARWLWLDREDAVNCLAVARLLSQTRAKRIRDQGFAEPIRESRVREVLAGAIGPANWTCAAAITRWLSDIPIERAREEPRAQPRKEPEPQLRDVLHDWIAMGYKVGRLLAARSIDRAWSAILPDSPRNRRSR